MINCNLAGLVKVRRSNGDINEGWNITESLPTRSLDNKIAINVTDPTGVITKWIRIEDMCELNGFDFAGILKVLTDALASSYEINTS